MVVNPTRDGSPGLWIEVDSDLVPRRLIEQLDGIYDHLFTVLHAPLGYESVRLVTTWASLHPRARLVRVTRDLDLDAVNLHRLRGDHSMLLLWLRDPELLADRPFVESLIAAAGTDQHVRIVSTSIGHPIAPLSQLAVRRQLLTLGPAELAWTWEERQDFLGALVPADEVLTAERQAWHGWPIATRLLRLQLQGDRTTLAQHPLLDDYIDGEVLARLDPEDLDVLVEMSTLPSHTRASVLAITQRQAAADVLERLPRLGIPLAPSSAGSLEILAPVRARLIARLARDPERLSELVYLTVAWLEREGEPIERIELVAQHVPQDTALLIVAEYLLRHFLDADVMVNLARMIRLLPIADWVPEMVQTYYGDQPNPLAGDSLVHLAASTSTRILQFGTAGRLGWALFQLPLARSLAYELPGMDEVFEVMRNPGPGAEDFRLLSLKAGLVVEHGLYLAHQGQLNAALPRLLEGAELSRMSRQLHYQTLGMGAAAWVQAARGYVNQAVYLANACLELSQQATGQETVGADYAHLALAEAALEMGDNEGVRRAIAACSPLKVSNRETAPPRIYLLAHSHALSQPTEAMTEIQSLYQMPIHLTDFHRLLLGGAQVTAYIVNEDLEGAERAMDDLPRPPQESELYLAWVLPMAVLRLAQGRPAEAAELLRPYATLDLESQLLNKTTLFVLQFYAEATTLTGDTESATRAQARKNAVARLLGLDLPGARHLNLHEESLPEKLTETELNVLRALASQESLTRIARRLFISINTLKTHTRRIYRKLGVGSRADAVARARSLNLLNRPDFPAS